MKNLESLQLTELDAREVRGVEGGLLGWDDILIAAVGAIVVEVVNNWDDFKDGFASAFK